jgi:hypothetical protein
VGIKVAYLGFKENGSKKEKYIVSSSFIGMP